MSRDLRSASTAKKSCIARPIRRKPITKMLRPRPGAQKPDPRATQQGCTVPAAKSQLRLAPASTPAAHSAPPKSIIQANRAPGKPTSSKSCSQRCDCHPERSRGTCFSRLAVTERRLACYRQVFSLPGNGGTGPATRRRASPPLRQPMRIRRKPPPQNRSVFQNRNIRILRLSRTVTPIPVACFCNARASSSSFASNSKSPT